jgi:hypothetical protein
MTPYFAIPCHPSFRWGETTHATPLVTFVIPSVKLDPTGRISRAAVDPFEKDSPLLPSGLLGVVSLILDSN